MDERRLHRVLRICRNIGRKVQHRYGLPDSDAEDLEQEMALAVLEVPDMHKDTFCRSLAAWRAADWVRRIYHIQGSVRVESDAHLVEAIDGGRCLHVWC